MCNIVDILLFPCQSTSVGNLTWLQNIAKISNAATNIEIQVSLGYADLENLLLASRSVNSRTIA